MLLSDRKDFAVFRKRKYNYADIRTVYLGFDDLEAIFFMTLLLLLYFADIPYLGNEVPFYLCRMTRKIWLAGQVVYIVCATAIYTVAILLSTILICGQRCYVGNIWSETAVKLAFTSAGKKLSLAASEKTLELTRPYACMTTIFFCYSRMHL